MNLTAQLPTDPKFRFKFQKSAKEAHEMLEPAVIMVICGESNVVTLKTVCKWYERFKRGTELIEDEQRSGLPWT